MKTVLSSTKRFLAVLMAFAMVVLSLPSSALTVQAAEVERYTLTQVAATDEDGNTIIDEVTGDPVMKDAWVRDANGEYVLKDGQYVEYEEPATASTMSTDFGNTLFGSGAEALEVTITNTDDTNVTVTVRKNNANGDAVTSENKEIGASDALYVSMEFSDGYALDTTASVFTIDGNATEVSTMTDFNGKSFTIPASLITDDITLTITPATVELAVDASETPINGDAAYGTMFAIKNESGQEIQTVKGGEDVTFQLALTDSAAEAAATKDTVFTNVKATIGDKEVSTAVSGKNGFYEIKGKNIVGGQIVVTADVYLPIEVDYTGVEATSATSDENNPTYLKYGTGLEIALYPKTFSGYKYVSATAVITNESGTDSDTIDLNSEDGETFTLGKDVIGTAKKIAISATGEKENHTIYVDGITDAHLTFEGKTTIKASETDYTFELVPAAGYEIDDDTQAVDSRDGKLTVAQAALEAGISAGNLKSSAITVYAVKHGVSITNAIASEVYPIDLTTVDPKTGVVTGKITVAADTSTAVDKDLDIVIGDITKYASYDVKFDGGAAPAAVTAADTIVAAGEQSVDLTSAGEGAATYMTDLKFRLTIGTDQGGKTYVFNGISYKIGADGSYQTIGTTGATKYTVTEATTDKAMTVDVTIAGSKLLGEVTLLVDAIEIETASVTIDDSTQGVSAAEWSDNGTDWNTYTAAIDSLETNDTLYVRATVDSDYEVTMKELATSEGFNISSVSTRNGKVTIKGIISADTAAINIVPVQVYPIVIEENYNAGIVSGIQYSTLADGSEWTSWKNYTSGVTVRDDAITSGGVKLRLKVASGYDVTATIDSANLALEPGTGADAGYLVSNQIDASDASKLALIAIAAGYPNDQVAVYNADTAHISRVAVTVDTAADNDAYYTAYAKANSTYAGVRKTANTENIYTVYQAGGNSAKSANLVITVTNAANYAPVLKAYSDISLTTEVSLTEGAEDDYTISNKNTAGTSRTYNISKASIQSKSIKAIAFETEAPTGVVKLLYPDGGTVPQYTASVDGVIVNEDATVNGTDFDGSTFDVELGKKIVFTIKPSDTDHTLTEAYLYSAAAGNVKEKNTKLSPKADSFTYTVTAGAVEQQLRVTELPIIKATALAEATDPSAAKDTTVTDNTTKQQTVKKTYTTGIEVGTTYTAGVEIGGAAASVAKVYVYNGKTEVTKNESGAMFQIPASAANKNLTVDVVVGTGEEAVTYAGLYTVKANPVLTGIKVTGVDSKYTLQQEVGTKATYAVNTTPAAASLNGFSVMLSTAADFAIDEEAGTVTTQAVTDGAEATLIEADKKVTISTPKKVEADLVIFYVDEDDDQELTKTSELRYSFLLTTKDSKVANSVPSVTQKGQTDNSLILNLALPTTVSSTTQKSLADNVALIYEVSWTKTSEDSLIAETSPVYILADGANQTETIKVLDETAGQISSDAKFDVTVKVYEIPDHNTAYTASDDLKGEIQSAGTTAIESKPSAKRTCTTKATRYPSKLSVKQLVKTIYAGQTYDPTSDLLLAEITADTATTYNVAGDYTVTDLPTSKPAATVEAPTTAIEIVSTLGAKVIAKDGKYYLAIPQDKINDMNTALANARLVNPSNSYDLKIVAPGDTANGTPQEVSVTIKMTIEQRAVYTAQTDIDDDDEPIHSNVYAEMSEKGAPLNTKYVSLQKKSGTALTFTPQIQYDTTSTKAAQNEWVWTTNNAVGITITPDAKTGKVTIARDYTFPADKDVSFDLIATSKYNTAIKLTWKIKLTDSADVQAQGDLVLAVPFTDGSGVQILAKKGDKLTAAQYEKALSALKPAQVGTNDVGQLILLKSGAVIGANGFVSSAYVVDDTSISGASSNAKVATITNVPATSTENGYAAVELAGDAIGNVTFTATPENTGVKKTLAVNFVTAAPANTATFKNYFSIRQVTVNAAREVQTIVAPASNWDNTAYGTDAAKKPTLAVTIQADNTIDLKVGMGDVTLVNGLRTDGHDAAYLTDYYTASVLTAGTGVKILDSNIREGYYKLSMYGKTGTVRVNGLTYTLTATGKSDVAAGTFTQTDALYADYNYAYYDNANAPAITFTSNKNLITTATKAVVTYDNTDAASEAFYKRYVKATGADVTLDSGNDAVGTSPKTGKAFFILPFEAYDYAQGDTFEKGSYNLYVTFTDGTDEVSAPQKFTVKTTTAPAVTPVAKYEFTIKDTSAQELEFQDNKGNAIAVTGFTNVMDTKTGAQNNFVGLFAAGFDPSNGDGVDGKVTLKGGNDLIQSKAADRTGYIEYTTDGGITTKSVKVTFTFNTGADFYKTELTTAIAAEAATWSAENVTSAKVLAAIKELLALPANLTMTMSDFVYTPAVSGASATITGTLNIKNSKDRTDYNALNVELTIPQVSVAAGTGNYGIGATNSNGGNVYFDYTITDGASKSYKGTSANGAVDVMNGATLTITKIYPANGYVPDSYWVNYAETDNVVNRSIDNKRATGTWSIGKVFADDTANALTIVAENAVTVTKGANITALSVAYTHAATDTQSEDSAQTASSAKYFVKAKTTGDFIVYATPAAGYNAVLVDNADKTHPIAAGAAQTGNGAKATFTGQTISKATTLATSVEKNNFKVTLNLTAVDGTVYDDAKASGVYTYYQYYDKTVKPNAWKNVPTSGEVEVPYLDTLQLRLTKKANVTVSKTAAGAYDVYVTQSAAGLTNEDYRGSESKTQTTLTSKKIEKATTLKFSAGMNYGLSLVNAATPSNAISALKYGTGTDTPASYSSKAVKVASGGTQYTFEYTVRPGYETFVVDENGDDVIPSLKSGTTDTYQIKGTVSAQKTFTVTAEKRTAIGGTLLGTGAVESAITTASYVTTPVSAADDVEDVADVVDEATISKAKIGDTITLYTVTAAGYDLQIQTQSPAQAASGTWTTVKGAKATAPALNRLVYVEGDAGVRTWAYMVKAADAIAAIRLNPVAQARTFQVTNNSKTLLTNVKYQIGGDAAKTAPASKVSTYYGASVKVTFEVPNAQYTPVVKVDGVTKSAVRGETLASGKVVYSITISPQTAVAATGTNVDTVLTIQ